MGLYGSSASLKESLVGSEKLPPTATGMIALSLPLAEGVGELELAVVFIPFGSGTDDLDGVLGAAGIALVGWSGGVVQLLPLDGFTTVRVVTLAASTSSGTPTNLSETLHWKKKRGVVGIPSDGFLKDYSLLRASRPGLIDLETFKDPLPSSSASGLSEYKRPSQLRYIYISHLDGRAALTRVAGYWRVISIFNSQNYKGKLRDCAHVSTSSSAWKLVTEKQFSHPH